MFASKINDKKFILNNRVQEIQGDMTNGDCHARCRIDFYFNT